MSTNESGERDLIQIDADSLTHFAYEILRSSGALTDEASQVSKSLVGANLRGYDSHGVMRLPHYSQLLTEGKLKPGAELQVEAESTTHLVTSGEWGFGNVQTKRLLDRLVEKVSEQPIVVGTMKNCGHVGRLGEYCEIAADAGFVSLMMVNLNGAIVRVAPPGGAEPRLSTNPIAFGVPHENSHLVADFSTSATAEGTVRVKRIAGEPVPESWLIDAQGNSTTDPNVLYGIPPGSIRPMGGDQAHKGFALSLLVEILAGALSGGSTAQAVSRSRLGNCVFLLLINPNFFGNIDHFKNEVRELSSFIRASRTAAGVERVLLPGDPERLSLAQRQVSGLEFDQGNWQALVELAQQLDVSVPMLKESPSTNR